jgi:hypothetical protein
MAGFSRLYCIGEPGGFQGADGVNPIWCQILVGDADRQWWEARYFEPAIRPLGNVSVVVPSGPDHVDALLDCCIAFLPHLFAGCPSLAEVRRQADGLERLDFDTDSPGVPAGWNQLRTEAREQYRRLHIWQARLEPVVQT